MAQLGALEQQLQRYGPLGQMLDSVSNSAVHPNAVDGQVLFAALHQGATAAGSGPAGPLLSSSPKGGVDIAGMLHQWADSLESCVPHFRSLAGHPGDGTPETPLAGDIWGGQPQGLTPVPLFVGGGGDSAPHPLVAPAAVRGSHAALLSTQLGLRRGELVGLQAMVRELGGKAVAVGEPRVRG